MKFVVIANQKDEALFDKVFKANARLFKDVQKDHEEHVVEYHIQPRTILLLNEVKKTLSFVKSLEIEFLVQMELD